MGLPRTALRRKKSNRYLFEALRTKRTRFSIWVSDGERCLEESPEDLETKVRPQHAYDHQSSGRLVATMDLGEGAVASTAIKGCMIVF